MVARQGRRRLPHLDVAGSGGLQKSLHTMPNSEELGMVSSELLGDTLSERAVPVQTGRKAWFEAGRFGLA